MDVIDKAAILDLGSPGFRRDGIFGDFMFLDSEDVRGLSLKKSAFYIFFPSFQLYSS